MVTAGNRAGASGRRKGEGRTPNPRVPSCPWEQPSCPFEYLDINGRELPTTVAVGRLAGWRFLEQGAAARTTVTSPLSGQFCPPERGCDVRAEAPCLREILQWEHWETQPRVWTGKDPEPRELAQGRAGALHKGKHKNKRPHAPRWSRGSPLGWRGPYCVTAGHRLMPNSGGGRGAGRGSSVSPAPFPSACEVQEE